MLSSINYNISYRPTWLSPMRDPVLEAHQKEVEIAKQNISLQKGELEAKQKKLDAQQKALSEF